MSDVDNFDLMEFLPYLLNQAAEQASREFQVCYKERYGMLRTEWRVLFHLGKFEAMTANDIVVAAKTHKTKISRAVQALSDKGFLMRTNDKNDRRREVLSLTKSGKSAYFDLAKRAAEFEQQFATQFEPGEMKMLKKMLNKIAAGETTTVSGRHTA